MCETGDRKGFAVQDASENTILFLDYYSYLLGQDDGSVLYWHETGAKTAQIIEFIRFSLSNAKRINVSPDGLSSEQQATLYPGSVEAAVRWQFASTGAMGRQDIELPHDWSQFGETLVLASTGTYGLGPSNAIFAFDWLSNRVEIFPQDWFNQGDYDFGYQWITRVARRSDGSIVGDGIRLGKFELDETFRQVKTWMEEDPFYRPVTNSI